MERYNRSAGSASTPTPPSAPVNPYYTEGNPGLGVPATQPGPWWFHMITEEMRAVITAAGLTPDHLDLTQLRQAIQAMIINGQKSIIIHDAVFQATVADEDVVYWHAANGEFTKALADGSAAQNAVGFADVTNAKVYVFGAAPIFAGLTPGAYYLDTTTPGAITTTLPATNIVKLGLAVSATEIYVDIDPIAGITQAQADARYTGIGYMLVRDEKASGTAGGSSVTTAMPTAQTRTLNTTIANTIIGASLSSNQITLPAGTYRINADAPSSANTHRAFLYNVTDGVVQIVGSNENCRTNGDTDPIASRSNVRGRFTITATKVFQLRHYTSEASASIGLGTVVSNAGYNEVYSQIEIIKES